MLRYREGAELLARLRLAVEPSSDDPDRRRPFVYGEDGFTANDRYMAAEHVAETRRGLDRAVTELRGWGKSLAAVD